MHKFEVIELEYIELDDLINKEFFNLEDKYSFCESEEVSNDSEKLFYEIKVSEIGSVEEEEIKEFINGETLYRTRAALLELCRRGIIEEGNYLISVCW